MSASIETMAGRVAAECARLKAALPDWHFAPYGKPVADCDAFVACYPPDRKTMAIDGGHNHDAIKATGCRIVSVCGPLLTVRVGCDFN